MFAIRSSWIPLVRMWSVACQPCQGSCSTPQQSGQNRLVYPSLDSAWGRAKHFLM